VTADAVAIQNTLWALLALRIRGSGLLVNRCDGHSIAQPSTVWRRMPSSRRRAYSRTFSSSVADGAVVGVLEQLRSQLSELNVN